MKPRIHPGWVLALVVCSPVVALAADDVHDKPAGLLDPNLQAFLWSALVFIVVLYILKKKAWGPILQSLDEREEKIKASLQAAERALEESKARERAHEDVMAEARREASAIVEEGKRDAQVVKDGIVADARKESEDLTRRARAEIERAKDIAVDEIHKQAVDLSVLIAEKVIHRTLTPDDHQQLIRETIDNYEKLVQ